MEARRHVTNVLFSAKLLIQSKVDPRFQMNIYICNAHIHFLCFFQSAHIEAFLLFTHLSCRRVKILSEEGNIAELEAEEDS